MTRRWTILIVALAALLAVGILGRRSEQEPVLDQRVVAPSRARVRPETPEAKPPRGNDARPDSQAPTSPGGPRRNGTGETFFPASPRSPDQDVAEVFERAESTRTEVEGSRIEVDCTSFGEDCRVYGEMGSNDDALQLLENLAAECGQADPGAVVSGERWDKDVPEIYELARETERGTVCTARMEELSRRDSRVQVVFVLDGPG